MSPGIMVSDLLVEGWRFIPQSFACVNMWQLLELSIRPDINLLHRDMPFCSSDWRPLRGIMDPLREHRISKIPVALKDQAVDAVYRISIPLRLKTDSSARKTLVFTTTELGWLPEGYCSGDIDIKTACEDEQFMFITPSRWSKYGLLRTGVPEDRIKLVPLGVDPGVFRPLGDAERKRVRKELGWNDRFVFLNVGAMTDNKGIGGLVEAFGIIATQYPESLLFLKGADNLYNSREILGKIIMSDSVRLNESARERIIYYGQPLPFQDHVRFYQAADAYVTPYMGEGFNLPALEAMACGLPVICTQGGPTDDFVTGPSALPITSREIPYRDTNYVHLFPDMACLLNQMERVIGDDMLRAAARTFGPQQAREHFSWRKVADQLVSIVSS